MLRKTGKLVSSFIMTAVLVTSLHFSIPATAQAQELDRIAAVKASSTLKASISKASMEKGDTKKVTLTYGGSSISASNATWKTSKSSVATVKNGTITAKGEGKATITAKYSGKTVTIDVTVKEEKGELVAAETKVTMVKGDTATITLKYDGSKLTGSKADWSTSKSSVVTVSNGVLTAKGKGTATITAKYKGETVKIQVTVNEDTKEKLVAAETKVTMVKGDTATINLKYDGSKLTGSKADWSTSKSSVVTVSNGVLTAKGKGNATITAKYKGETVKIQVTVNEDTKDKLVAAETKVTMVKGDTATINLKYDGSKLTGSKADWSTSKSSVVTVSNGVLTAKGKGNATITAKYKGETVKIQVTVNEDTKDKLVAAETKVTMVKGDTATINLKYDGSKLTGSKADWSTSKSSVVTVSNGVLTAKGKGTATITAKYKGETVKIQVTVNEDTKNKLEAAETKVTMVKGDTATINLKYDGSKLTGSKADWSTSKSSVVTVSNGVLTAKGKGTATITAEYKGETVKIQVTVNEESKDKLVATKTKISMDKGDTETISLKYDGSKLTGSKADWSTSKSSVATVKNGVVTAKGAGTATITAEYKNEKVKIEITVSDSKDKLSVDDDSISIKVGKTETIKVTYNGKKVSGSDVKWSTSKSSVAKVKDGVVTGKKKGKAVITAKYKGEEVEIRVTVK
ncbi:hypothetical protein T458_16645 [Brevibacillus panacihumi W25]|uniref:BIG2 domain-containing protein n=1 Tax=Brevibacillus panacihumi W25 TaxID=1408254 RepID=V6M2P2_9BACL|nr:Ig-like domain-containing protein [Brevibacillus panacihumi]EST52597.1 hypothetical protein T458_16645 [Brevibacillus panacihumi W25]